jgi:1-acyl-sn-glycerol-3-phosphate acyltransferase
MQQKWANVRVANPGQVSPRFAGLIARFLLPLVRLLWRPTLTGTDHLPSGPFLLVANHSAGVGFAELHCFAALYLHQVGAKRPLAGFALPIGFAVWPLSAIHRELGTIPSSYQAAAATLAQGVPILVFPGGDHESLQPIWHANRVDFARRLGFLKIARAAHVPIVPLGIRGGAMTAPLLWRANWLATLLVQPRLMGVKRWAISVLGLLGAVALAVWLPWSWPVRALCVWLWLGSPLTFLPWLPWTLRLRIGPALAPEALFGAGDDARLPDALAKVQAAVQAQVG